MENSKIENQEYRNLIEELKKNKSQRTIQNGKKEKVIILLENLIDYAKESINIYSGKLSKNIWKDKKITEKFTDFVSKRKGTLRILIDNDLEIKEYNKYTKKIKSKLTDLGHFITIDKLAIRLETLSINKNNENQEATAIACFNDKDINKYLRKRFNDEYSRAEKLNPA